MEVLPGALLRVLHEQDDSVGVVLKLVLTVVGIALNEHLQLLPVERGCHVHLVVIVLLVGVHLPVSS